MIVLVGQDASSCLVQKLAGMQESGELCDFSIFVGGSEVKAHRCVLAACCDYFKTSFSFGESSQSLTQTDLTHLGCDVKVVDKVIRSFYTNEIDLEPNGLESVLQLVDYFMCESLRLCVETFMENSLTFHTAVPYFQLALQYQLNSTNLFSNVKRLLFFRFHDYFIYQPETLEASQEVITVFMTYGIFSFCNPLQLTKFLLNNMKNSIEKLKNPEVQVYTDVSKAVLEKIDSTFQILSVILGQVTSAVLEKWKPQLVKYLVTWKESYLCDTEKHFTLLRCHVQILEIELSGEEFTFDKMCCKKDSCYVCSKFLELKNSKQQQNYGKSTCHSENDPNIGVPVASLDEFEPDNEARGGYSACTSKSIQGFLLSLNMPNQEVHKLFQLTRSEKPATSGALTIQGEPRTLSVMSRVRGQELHWVPHEIQTQAEQSSTDNTAESVSLSSTIRSSAEVGSSLENFPRIALKPSSPDAQKPPCNILVVLAPSAQMAAQLMAVDDGQVRPLLRSPQLDLSFFDVEMNTWRHGCQLDLPVQGAMLEKHSWRIAYLDSCLYMFSLGRSVGLQYNILHYKWTSLSCDCLFTAHNSNAPVKSVIPITVGRRLIVLSMSREAKLDRTFHTQQHYYEMEPANLTFEHVAVVNDERMNMPVTQWTVSGDILVTVKASTMMYRNLSRVQYIHIYNSATRELETHEIVCAMEAGIKVLMKDQLVYLIDREGWCRSYDLQSSVWTGLKRYPHISLSSPSGSNSEESFYPALTRVTCHAGSSRWEITTSRTSANSRLQQTVVDVGGDLSTISHPPPPFQFMTVMCPGTMSREDLDCRDQSVFAHSEI